MMERWKTKTLLKMKIDCMAHTRGCAGLEGVDVVPLRRHGVKTLESLSIKLTCTSGVFSLMLVSTLGFDSMDGS